MLQELLAGFYRSLPVKTHSWEFAEVIPVLMLYYLAAMALTLWISCVWYAKCIILRLRGVVPIQFVQTTPEGTEIDLAAGLTD